MIINDQIDQMINFDQFWSKTNHTWSKPRVQFWHENYFVFQNCQIGHNGPKMSYKLVHYGQNDQNEI